MTKTQAHTFPAAWIVLAAVAPFIAILGFIAAERAGVRMTIHDTSTVGYVVQVVAAVIVLAALVIEGGALFIGARALWTSSQARTPGNVGAFLFGIVVMLGIIAAATIAPGKVPW